MNFTPKHARLAACALLLSGAAHAQSTNPADASAPAPALQYTAPATSPAAMKMEGHDMQSASGGMCGKGESGGMCGAKSGCCCGGGDGGCTCCKDGMPKMKDHADHGQHMSKPQQHQQQQQQQQQQPNPHAEHH